MVVVTAVMVTAAVKTSTTAAPSASTARGCGVSYGH
jgi:hypothetical protein